MQTYSRIKRIKERKKRKQLLYRTVVRMAVVPIVLVFAVLLYLLIAFQKIEEVDQKEKSLKTEVAGEKTELVKQEIGSPTVTYIPEESIHSPTITITTKPTQEHHPLVIFPAPSALPQEPTRAQIIIPTPTPEKLETPSYMTKYAGSNIMPINQGTIAFTVVVDWKDEDQILFRGNFNGVDRKNLIEIVGSGKWLAFDIYNDMGEEDGSEGPNGDMGDDHFGKTFNIVVTWDFTGDTKIKRIYINGELKREIFAETIPSLANSQILIGKINDLRISDKWEDR
ncbi:MAG: hypothetical protein A3D74_01725 [Candidatus Levybacteria bacterium RIFCSPHIGHO2_02_FULL_37_13]|nr:MAG: hypothetical protein A3D74_01725 [Candidatus Levybacteria bacterium RIFCSPHIGHO2_02_FULL_37_13]OGH29606.1 MAG: hypothetical protein A3E40_01280 [Candidatus Levybacteria bacterium RIFCSPHIGHO2_12_FULL_37_9]OGH37336.1 MAG: hypothetical protein A3B41_05035 [Candidatus Levybacteria bacterium RIFCSPLOWO2_01_FULL_37_26]